MLAGCVFWKGCICKLRTSTATARCCMSVRERGKRSLCAITRGIPENAAATLAHPSQSGLDVSRSATGQTPEQSNQPMRKSLQRAFRAAVTGEGISQTRHSPYPAPLLCNPSARSWHQSAHHPGIPGSCFPHHDRHLYPSDFGQRNTGR